MIGQDTPSPLPEPAPRPDVAPLRAGPRQLAHALGMTVEALANRTLIDGKAVSRRTLYKFFDRGAPFTSEAALRQWLGESGARVGAVLPSLGDVVAQALGESAQVAPSAPAGQQVTAPTANPDGSTFSTKQQAELAAVRARDSTTMLNQMAIEEKAKILLHRNAVAAMLEGFGTDVIAALNELPALLTKRLGDALPIEMRPTLRVALAAELLTVRATITTKVPERLQALLSGDIT